MELKEVLRNKFIYDGLEEKFYSEQTVRFDDGAEIRFFPTDLIELEDFEKTCRRELFEYLLKAIPTIKRFTPASDFSYYKNDEDLTPHIMENDEYIIVISIGEFQPCRYKIKLEAAFLK